MQSDDMREELVNLGSGAHTLAMQILGNSDDAADAVQDALVAVLVRPDAYRPEQGALKPWFLTVVRNRAIDLLRRRRSGHDKVDELPGAVNDPQRAAELDDRDRLVRLALDTLDRDKREILILRDYLDLNYAEIAVVLGIGKGTVMSRLHRARTAFGKAFRDFDER